MLSEKQQAIANCDLRFRVVVAGRRAGKTFLAMREACRFASKANSTVWMLANSRQQIKSLCWRKLKKKLKQLNWLVSTNESELTIELINGSCICLKSAEQGDNLRGEALDAIIIDEFCDLDIDTVWSQIIRPSLSDRRGHALFLGTPKASNQLAKDLFDNHLRLNNWASFTYTTAEGGFVDAEEIAQARLDLAPKVFKQEYEASWESFAGLIFGEFGDHNITEVEGPRNANEPIVAGVDFNITPISCVIGRRTQQGVEIFDEIFMDNSNTSELAAELKNRYPLNPITLFPDPAGQQRKTSANGLTDIKILENAGFACRYNRSHNLVKDRVNSANSLFYLRPDSTTRFKIDPRKAPKTIRSLRNWAYKEGTMIPDKNSGWDHACDALTYAIDFLFPIKRDLPPTEPKRFGHALA